MNTRRCLVAAVTLGLATGAAYAQSTGVTSGAVGTGAVHPGSQGLTPLAGSSVPGAGFGVGTFGANQFGAGVANGFGNANLGAGTFGVNNPFLNGNGFGFNQLGGGAGTFGANNPFLNSTLGFNQLGTNTFGFTNGTTFDPVTGAINIPGTSITPGTGGGTFFYPTGYFPNGAGGVTQQVVVPVPVPVQPQVARNPLTGNPLRANFFPRGQNQGRRIARSTGTSNGTMQASNRSDIGNGNEAINVANTEDAMVAQRMSAIMEERPLVEGQIVSVGDGTIRARYTLNGQTRTGVVPMDQVFFFRGDDLESASENPGALVANTRVLMPQPGAGLPSGTIAGTRVNGNRTTTTSRAKNTNRTTTTSRNTQRSTTSRGTATVQAQANTMERAEGPVDARPQVIAARANRRDLVPARVISVGPDGVLVTLSEPRNSGRVLYPHEEVFFTGPSGVLTTAEVMPHWATSGTRVMVPTIRSAVAGSRQERRQGVPNATPQAAEQPVFQDRVITPGPVNSPGVAPNVPTQTGDGRTLPQQPRNSQDATVPPLHNMGR